VAIQHLDQVIFLEPSATAGHFYLALAYDRMCDSSPNPCDPHWSELAIQEYSRVLELDPSHKDALKSIASLLYRLARLDDAERLYRKAAKLDANDPEALYAIAVFDWVRTYRVLVEARARLNLPQKQPLIDLPACHEIRAKNLAEVEEGLTLLTTTLQLVSYVEPQVYMAVLYRERAELQCGHRAAYKRDLRSEQQWWNRACVTWHDSKQVSPPRWLRSLPPPPPARGDTCSWNRPN
jgi:tetratricopeptide (TPR) repeat protein